MRMFRRLPTLDEARRIVWNHFEPKPLGDEEITLREAYGRILAQDAVATLNVPPFDRSTVDGYAVKSEDTIGADESRPSTLTICGAVRAGQSTNVVVKQGMAAEIVTGAPMPKGANAVVMLEYARRTDNKLLVESSIIQNENVMRTGSDIRKKETILRTGKVLGSREIGVLAAIGAVKVKVYRIPRVAVMSTGAEITEPGKRLTLGRIYDINAYSLGIATLESGGKPVYRGIFPDSTKKIRDALVRAIGLADMVVTSGGVSVGPKDYLPQILDTLGRPGVIVCGIAIKPGKPTTVASIVEKPIFSLPGHPTSALLVFHLLVRPFIQCLSARKHDNDVQTKAHISRRVFSAKGRRTLIMIKLKRDGRNRLIAYPVENGLSGAITTLAKADGFVETNENQQFIDTDDEVTVHLFNEPDNCRL